MGFNDVKSRHKKVSNNHGSNAEIKRDGYAAGSVPQMSRATKPGKTEHHPYSGPEIQVPER
jgi:hypothetical protein